MLDSPRPSNDSPNPVFGRERFAWWMLFGIIRLSVNSGILFLAAAGALLGSAGWWLCGVVFINEACLEDNLPLQVDTRYLNAFPGERHADACPIGCHETETGKSVIEKFGPWPADPGMAVPYRIMRPVCQLARPGGGFREFGYYGLGGLWTLLVWSVFGGAITRIAVKRLGVNEQINPMHAVRFAIEKLPSHVGGAILPLSVAFLLSMPLMLLGFFMRANLGVFLVGFLYFIMLPVAFLLAVVTLGWLFAWPLIWGVLSSDGTDAFDAVSRAYSYTCQRPIRYAFYLVLTFLIGYFGWLLVWAFSELVVQTGMWALTMGAGEDQMSQILLAINNEPVDSGALRFGARLIAFWNGIARTFGSAFAYSYFWCGFAAIYLLMRYDVDATELDEIIEDPIMPEGEL